jgi:glycosyltransferase involved in cell wall biosynthesis
VNNLVSALFARSGLRVPLPSRRAGFSAPRPASTKKVVDLRGRTCSLEAKKATGHPSDPESATSGSCSVQHRRGANAQLRRLVRNALAPAWPNARVNMDDESGKPRLALIHATHASLAGMRESGVLQRYARVVHEYTQTFDVSIYSMDTEDFSTTLGARHVPMPWLPRPTGLRHLAFWLWLIVRAPGMRGVLKAIGSNTPTLYAVKLLAGAPLLVTFQFDYADNAGREYGRQSMRARVARLLEWAALTPADLIAVTTPALGARIRSRYGRDSVLLPNWVDLPDLDPDCAPPEHREPIILYAGRLHFAKGLNVLLDAFAKVRKRYSDAQLVICGSGDERDLLELRAAELRLQDVIRFLGRQDNETVLEWMRRASVFVLPTLTAEGHPKALLEAMACGTPSVATDVPGNHDVLTDGVTGLLTRPGDADELGMAILRLLDDTSLAQALGFAARTAVASLSFPVIVDREIRTLVALLRAASEGALDSKHGLQHG